MFGSPKMFCKFHAHKGPQKASKDTCGHFQCVSVPWTCESVPQKKFSNQHLSGISLQNSYRNHFIHFVLTSLTPNVTNFCFAIMFGDLIVNTRQFWQKNLSIVSFSDVCFHSSPNLAKNYFEAIDLSLYIKSVIKLHCHLGTVGKGLLMNHHPTCREFINVSALPSCLSFPLAHTSSLQKQIK